MAFTITWALPAAIDPQQRRRTGHDHGGKLTGDALVRYHLTKLGHAAAVIDIPTWQAAPNPYLPLDSDDVDHRDDEPSPVPTTRAANSGSSDLGRRSSWQ